MKYYFVLAAWRRRAGQYRNNHQTVLKYYNYLRLVLFWMICSKYSVFRAVNKAINKNKMFEFQSIAYGSHFFTTPNMVTNAPEPVFLHQIFY